jgi:squalene-hopene/tetraprenyl-beta-curcumene cyclase
METTSSACIENRLTAGSGLEGRERWRRAWLQARQVLLDERNAAGHWVGELSTSALSTATAISALAVVGRTEAGNRICPADERRTLINGGLAWLDRHQNPDGGFGDTDLSLSNISTTMLVLAAWRACEAEDSRKPAIERAQAYVERCGGVPGLRRRYGRDKTFAVPILANAAIAGSVSWKEVAALPFEAACVPQSWYRFMQLPVVSYAIPALVAIGQAKHACDPSWNPLVRWIRNLAVKKSRRVLRRMQPASGGFLEAIPLTSFVVMGLSAAGADDDPVVTQGVKFLKESIRSDGSWPIDTNLATWNTDLAIGALAVGTEKSAENLALSTDRLSDRLGTTRDSEPNWMTNELLEWVLKCQHREVHPFTGAKPGGWGWSDLSGAVPDADDTPAALLALATWNRMADWSPTKRAEIEQRVIQGAEWLLDLQNRDGGWPTFCRGWGKLPFDRSGNDLTAHAMRALNAWKEVIGASKCDRAIERGWRYLERGQRTDGSWLPLWFGNQDQPNDENPIYGTVKVLAAFRDLDRLESAAATRALAWLQGQQHDDGSWGGGVSVRARTGDSVGSIEETSLALDLLGSLPSELTEPAQLARGYDWLSTRVEEGRFVDASPIGFYFAKLWYHERLYPQIFTVSALARAANA